MASLPSVVAHNSLKLENEFKKNTVTSLPFEKKNHSPITWDKALEPLNIEFKEALSLINEGSEKVESASYVPLLQECIKKHSVAEAESIHGHIIKMGINEDLFLMTFLVNVYAKCGTMGSARKVFDNLPKRNVVTWTSLMSGYVHNGQPDVAINVFQEMLEAGGFPTNYTLCVAFNACSLLGHFELGKQIHAYVVKYEIGDDTSIGNALCSLYSKSRNLDSSVKAFRMISDKNVISWTTAISACGDNGDSALGLSLFVDMLCADVEPNEFTLTSVISLCCIMQALKIGSQIHSLNIKMGYGSNLRVTNSIMYLYLKNGWIIEAKKLFDGMETISLVTWNAMIAGLAQMMDLGEDGMASHSSGFEALNTYLRLHRSGLKPDLFTFSSVLTVCSSLVALEQGEQIHAQVIKSGFLSDVVVGTALVNMYNKCGSIDRASKAFVEMSTRTLISWTSMITAFAQHGYSKQALQLFEDMRFVGVRPNKVTFVGVLSACSHAGLVEEALAYFDKMKKEYKIKPVMDHYACLIDMFVRLGRIEEAFDFVKKMDFEPNEFIWSLLIAGCRSHGKLELGFYAAEQLLNLNPKNSEAYFLLLNMYLSAERWKDVSRVRKLMKDEKIGKLKDWSWISIRDKVHSFRTGDRLNPPYENIDNFLSDLHDKASTMGFQLQTTLELKNEEYDEATFPKGRHSEKSAVAFGLLSTPSAAPIRVIKSISMCRDCHNFMKFISQLTSRKILIRDSKRLHKFVNGLCSCGDFGSLV